MSYHCSVKGHKLIDEVNELRNFQHQCDIVTSEQSCDQELRVTRSNTALASVTPHLDTGWETADTHYITLHHYITLQ